MGKILTGAAAIVLLGALIFDTTGGNGGVYNLGALQYQLMLWQGGLALLVAGLIIMSQEQNSGHREVAKYDDDDDVDDDVGDWPFLIDVDNLGSGEKLVIIVAAIAGLIFLLYVFFAT
jgi:hypothetical protein